MPDLAGVMGDVVLGFDSLDATRPVIGNDGWESVATDIIGIHDYDEDARRLARQYHADGVLPRLFKRERPGGRLLVLGGQPADMPIMLTEDGGITLEQARAQGGWGRTTSATAEDFAEEYHRLLDVVRELGLLSGFCYTQFADTHQEANGRLYGDRTPKIPIPVIRLGTAGPVAPQSEGLDQMESQAAHERERS